MRTYAVAIAPVGGAGIPILAHIPRVGACARGGIAAIRGARVVVVAGRGVYTPTCGIATIVRAWVFVVAGVRSAEANSVATHVTRRAGIPIVTVLRGCGRVAPEAGQGAPCTLLRGARGVGALEHAPADLGSEGGEKNPVTVAFDHVGAEYPPCALHRRALRRGAFDGDACPEGLARWELHVQVPVLVYPARDCWVIFCLADECPGFIFELPLAGQPPFLGVGGDSGMRHRHHPQEGEQENRNEKKKNPPRFQCVHELPPSAAADSTPSVVYRRDFVCDTSSP